MGIVDKVLSQIGGEALTPEEVSERTGIRTPMVRETLDFLLQFGLAKAEGPRVVASDEIMDLPEN